jgi:ClpP class serine protease
MAKKQRLILETVQNERQQGHGTRRIYYRQIENHLGKPVVSFFTSFRYPAMMTDEDAAMLEGVLQKSDVGKGFALLLSSPGGNGLAAERIINICRSYSGKNGYQVIVPGKAKSAATMVCFGATKILMSNTSELGPIDPQIFVLEGNYPKVFSICNLVKSYSELFDKATKEKGNLQPYLQQLAHYDARDIEEYQSQIALAEDIALKALASKMMRHYTREQIRSKISVFLSPEKVKVHGRPIYYEEVKDCGLNASLVDARSALWSNVSDLYFRLNDLVSNDNVAKCVESLDYSFIAKQGA